MRLLSKIMGLRKRLGFSSIRWIKAEIDLAGITIDKNTKITIKQTQWPAKTANRWFLDNIKITKAE